MKNIYLDIETGPLPEDQLAAQMPEFEAPGNLKDPTKIAAALQEKRDRWREDAALKAVTGRIIAATLAKDYEAPEFLHIGDGSIKVEDSSVFISELYLVEFIIKEAKAALDSGARLFTFNGESFDLPFLCQRAAVHGLPGFARLMQNFKGRWSWNENHVDVLKVWCGGRSDSESRKGNSLKAVALALGVGTKDGNGKEFADLLRTDPAKARDYAVHDVELLRKVTQRMGLA